LAVLENGDYIASHDWFGPGTEYNTTAVLVSKDKGENWRLLTEIKNQWWSNLFVHRDNLYIMGVTHRYGDIAIRRSCDGGKTWTVPKDADSGLLRTDARYHTAPCPVKYHDGRIWRAVEDAMAPGGWGKHFRAVVLSAPADADLLKADHWTASEPLAYDHAKLPGNGWLEGNIVVTPDGEVINLLRVAEEGGDRAAIVHVSDDGKTLSFDPEKDLIDFPGGAVKFTIRYDPVSGYYWTLASKQKAPPATRNVLVLTRSKDLKHWEIRTTVFRHYDRQFHAWQYIDWLFDGDDILFVSRTAWDGSHNYHDANYMTFHRLENFRTLDAGDDREWLGERPVPVTHETKQLRVVAYGTPKTIGTLKDGAIAYGNRKYTWQEVPEQFQGWNFIRTNGGLRPQVDVHTKEATTLYFAASTKAGGLVPPAWQPLSGIHFHYTDANQTEMSIWKRAVEKGETIDLPQPGWTGGILLYPPVKTGR
jgi:hypothetical protein